MTDKVTEDTQELQWVTDAADREDTISGPVPWPRYYPLYKASWHERLRHWIGHRLTQLLAKFGMLDPYDEWL